MVPALLVLVRHRNPGVVRIEALHFLELFKAVHTEVLFVDNAVVANDEAFDSGYSVNRRTCNQRKSSDHDTLHNEIHLAHWSRRSLSFEDLKVIAVIRLLTRVVALFDCACNFLADRTSPAAIGILPGQAILLSGRA